MADLGDIGLYEAPQSLFGGVLRGVVINDSGSPAERLVRLLSRSDDIQQHLSQIAVTLSNPETGVFTFPRPAAARLPQEAERQGQYLVIAFGEAGQNALVIDKVVPK